MKIIRKLGFIFLFAVITAGCAQKTVLPPDSAQYKEDELYEVVVKQVVINYVDGGGMTPVIILANKENERQFIPIWVGVSEGISIDMALSKRAAERPGTHDLFASVLGQFEMKLVKVVITDLREQTYIAAMTLESHGKTLELDARPSDAIALALRSVAPVFISQKVIYKSGWIKLPELNENPKESKGGDNLL